MTGGRSQTAHNNRARMALAAWWSRFGILSLLLAATAITLPAQTLTTLVTFDGTNGEHAASLVQGGDGNLYGTTLSGGTNGYGTLFKMTPAGTLTTLYSFCAQTNCTDGAYPDAGLVLATDGNFYGTTGSGGTYSNNICYGPGCGTVFKITPQGTLTTLYSFCSLTNCVDGESPGAALVQAVDGNLYGTTFEGGNTGGACATYGCGTVFKITRSGTLTTLHSFDGTDGALMYAGLIQAVDGNLYGATSGGGAEGYGTVFKITPSGTLTTLHSFDFTDGEYPTSALVQATDGGLYETTEGGGASTACGTLGCGTVFKITPSGTLTTLHSFDATDGEYPNAGLIQATDGNFYGTTSDGGVNDSCTFGCGTVFKITRSGTLTTLHSFCSQSGCTDGYDPYAGLIQATDGNLYGTSNFGGTYGGGTVFSLAVGLGPFVETLPTLGPVGAPVKIRGTNLTGTTSVTFNGTAATFTVNAEGTAIKTTVPSGATTGTVQVLTPGGTLSSNVPFRVRH